MKEDIDGFLVGGASLKPQFHQIVEACDNAQKWAHNEHHIYLKIIPYLILNDNTFPIIK